MLDTPVLQLCTAGPGVALPPDPMGALKPLWRGKSALPPGGGQSHTRVSRCLIGPILKIFFGVHICEIDWSAAGAYFRHSASIALLSKHPHIEPAYRRQWRDAVYPCQFVTQLMPLLLTLLERCRQPARVPATHELFSSFPG